MDNSSPGAEGSHITHHTSHPNKPGSRESDIDLTTCRPEAGKRGGKYIQRSLPRQHAHAHNLQTSAPIPPAAKITGERQINIRSYLAITSSKRRSKKKKRKKSEKHCGRNIHGKIESHMELTPDRIFFVGITNFGESAVFVFLSIMRYGQIRM